MDIPQELKIAIENQLVGIKSNQIIENYQKISSRYRNNIGDGKIFVNKQEEALSYAISRMPSTYCAIYSALDHILKNYNEKINTCYDMGAGTGAATWAVNQFMHLEKCTCFEREQVMINKKKKLMKGVELLKQVDWKKFDILKDNFTEKADLVITSYMINELPEENKNEIIKKLWNMTNKILLIIEPGTPAGFKNIVNAREILLKEGANIIAPCSHQNKCPIKEDDWCSFYVRVNRSGIQRLAKKGELGYEDEKFSYIAFSKTPINNQKTRILRHPQIYQGYVKIKVCTNHGIEEKIYSKKYGEIYKKIKKLNAGDIIENNTKL